MTDFQFPEKPTVEIIDVMGSDASIVRAARVSLSGENSVDEWGTKEEGLINYLLKNKHGSPFEHTALTFYVKAPIFVFREFHRHRIGFSYNEISGRYSKLNPEFYVPADDRPLVNVGTSAKPQMAPADPGTVEAVQDILRDNALRAWENYEILLGLGIANEVARAVLPVNIMSQMYVTCNARSLMNFLTLRTQDENAAHVSRPQYEIQQVARDMEDIFALEFPTTYRSYQENKRVAP